MGIIYRTYVKYWSAETGEQLPKKLIANQTFIVIETRYKYEQHGNTKIKTISKICRANNQLRLEI